MRVNPHDEDAWPGIVLLCGSALLTERFKKKLDELGFTGDLYLACTPAEALSWEHRCLARTTVIWADNADPLLWLFIGTYFGQPRRRVLGSSLLLDLRKSWLGFDVWISATDIEELAVNALISFRRGE